MESRRDPKSEMALASLSEVDFKNFKNNEIAEQAK